MVLSVFSVTDWKDEAKNFDLAIKIDFVEQCWQLVKQAQARGRAP